MAFDRLKTLGIRALRNLRIEWNAAINLAAIGRKVNRKLYGFKLAVIAELSKALSEETLDRTYERPVVLRRSKAPNWLISIIHEGVGPRRHMAVFFSMKME